MAVSPEFLRSVMLSLVLNMLVACALHADAETANAPLADAVERQEMDTIRELLEEQADVNAAQADGMTALHWSVYLDDAETTRSLIHAGARVDIPNRYGVTPLFTACANGNSIIVEQLLDEGADFNRTLAGGETPLMTAARTGRVGTVGALLAKGAAVDVREKNGQTALMWAAAEGHVNVVDILLNSGADFRTPLESGFTPLTFAVRQGHIEVTRRLLAAGADVNEAMQPRQGPARKGPPRGMSPLLLAIENGHFELATFLLDAGADPNDQRTGFAPLHAISWVRKPAYGDNEAGDPPPIGSGNIDSLQFTRILVQYGAKVNLKKQSSGGGRGKFSTAGSTPFLCAAGTADVPLMRVLLELGADPSIANKTGRTPLMMAAGIGSGSSGDEPGTEPETLEAVQFLLQLGADINAVDRNGETAMHGAAYKSMPSVVRCLADHGADIQIWSKKSKQGRTPLSIAQGYRPGNFKPSYPTVRAIERIMLAHGMTPPPPPKQLDGGYRD